MGARALACALLPLGGVLVAADGPFNESQLVEAALGNFSNGLGLAADAMDFDILANGSGSMLPLLSMGPSSVAADVKGVRAMFGDSAVNGACKKVCDDKLTSIIDRGCTLVGSFSVNENNDNRAYITQGAVQWSQPTKRSLGVRQVSQQTVTNYGDVEVTQEVRLVNSVASSVQVQTTNTISIGRELSVEVGIPEGAKVTGKRSFTFSTSKSRTQTDTKTSQTWNTVHAKVPPKSQLCITLEVDHETYDADFSVPVCYNGRFECSYGRYGWFGEWHARKCKGQYKRAASFNDIFGSAASCKTLRGHVTSNQFSNANGRVTLGACSRRLGANDTADVGPAEPLVQDPPILL